MRSNRKNFRWSHIPGIIESAFTVKNLNQDEAYVFRVVAINRAGRSTPSEESDYLHLRKEVLQEAPAIQEPLSDTITKRHTTLSLSCIISGYPEPTVEWFKDGGQIIDITQTYSNRCAKLVIEKTSEHTSGTYKCIAKNVSGIAESECHVQVGEEPVVHVNEIYLSQKLRIDAEYNVSAMVTGYPRPKLVWYKSKTKLEAKANTKMVYEDTTASLQISKLKRSHAGKYVIEATNEHGTSRKELSLTVIDRPSAPEGPLQIRATKKDTVQLEWKVPMDCGGLDISQYTIEKCSVDQNTWIKVEDVSSDSLTCTVSKLKINGQYQFRVTASNAIGDSEPLESEVYTMRLAAEKPSAPRGPIQVSGMTQDSCVISWNKSESDGGSAIIQYMVDVKMSTEKTWTSCGVTSAQVTHLLITDMPPGTGFDVRIFARNAIGDSSYLESTESIITGRLPSKLNLIYTLIFTASLTLHLTICNRYLSRAGC